MISGEVADTELERFSSGRYSTGPEEDNARDFRRSTNHNAGGPTETAESARANLISIVLPTHNGTRYIEQSIESCLRQTCRNWELIIVDDGSIDDTASKIARYADDRIRVVRHAMNRGLSAALNSGFAAARGDFLTWTSDDNYYRPAALDRMLAFLLEHEEVDFVYTDNEFVDDEGRRTYYFWVEPPAGLLNGNCVGACFLYRRRVGEVVGPYAQDIPLAEDYDYWLRVSIYFRMAPLHENLYCYRFHGQSLTSRFSRATVRGAMNKSLMRHLRAIRWANAGTKAWACLNEARRAQHEGRMADLARCLTFGVSFAPTWAVSHLATWLGRLSADISAP